MWCSRNPWRKTDKTQAQLIRFTVAPVKKSNKFQIFAKYIHSLCCGGLLQSVPLQVLTLKVCALLKYNNFFYRNINACNMLRMFLQCTLFVWCLFYIDFWIPLTILSQPYELNCTLWMSVCVCGFFSVSCLSSTIWPPELCEECVYLGLKLLFIVTNVPAWNRIRNVSHLYSTSLWYKPLSLMYSHRTFSQEIIDF